MSKRCEYPIVRPTVLHGIIHDTCGKPATVTVDGKSYCKKHFVQLPKKGDSDASIR